jgi:drug/metabolite transporter (DMT)-like permease
LTATTSGHPLRAPTPGDLARLVAVGAIWGASFVFIEIALRDTPPLVIAAGRVSLAALTIGTVLLFLGAPLPRDRSTWRLLTVIGLFNTALPFLLISWGQKFTTGGESAILMSFGPILALALSHVLTKDDRITPTKSLGMLCGLAGVVVLVYTPAELQPTYGLAGRLAIIGAAASYALSSVLARRVGHLSALSVSAAVTFTATAYMIPIALLIEGPAAVKLSTDSLVSLIYLGVVATGIGFLLRFQIIRYNGASFMSQAGYLVPLFGIFWGWLWLDERLGINALVALALILAGIGLTRYGQRAEHRMGV